MTRLFVKQPQLHRVCQLYIHKYTDNMIPSRHFHMKKGSGEQRKWLYKREQPWWQSMREMLGSATVLALLLALCHGSARPWGQQEHLSDTQKKETSTKASPCQDIVKPYQKFEEWRGKRGVWEVLPENMNTSGRLDSHTKQTLVTGTRYAAMALKKSLVRSIEKYFLRRKNASAKQKSQLQSILKDILRIKI